MMKKALSILFLFISINTFAQRDTVVIKIPKGGGVSTTDTNHLRNDIDNKLDAISITKTTDATDTIHKVIEVAKGIETQVGEIRTPQPITLEPVGVVHIDSTGERKYQIRVSTSNDSTFAAANDSTLPTTKAVKIFASKTNTYAGYGLLKTDSTMRVDSSIVLPRSTANGVYASKSDTLNQSRLPYWKKWVIFGDSFSSIGYHYTRRVDTLLNLTGTVTQAVSGAMIKGQTEKLDSILTSNPNYLKQFNIISLLVGVNDFAGATYELGTRADTAGQNTYAGYLKHFIETALTANPRIELYVMTPPEANTASVPFHGLNSHNWGLKDLENLIALICSDYGVQCIDLHSLANFNLQTIPVFTDDNIHPNYYGSVVIGGIVAGAFMGKNNKGDLSTVTYKNGNYGAGTYSPVAKFDVPGSSVNSSTNLNHYKSVANFTSSPITGTMKIMMPKGWSDNIMTIVINGYDFSSAANWQVIISGKNLAAGSWSSYKARIVGSAPFKLVRLSYDSVSAKNVVLLGDITTSWVYPSAEVSDLILNQGILSGWGGGWSISVISAETNIATLKTVTPVLSSYETTSGNYLFGTTTDNGKGKIQVNGRIDYSNDPILAVADSLTAPPKKYIDAMVATKNSGIGNVNYIPYWNAAYSLTPSTFSISGDNLYGNGTNVGIQISSGAMWSNVAFRATAAATGMYWDDTYTSIRWLVNGANSLKLFNNKTLQYYSHPSVSASPYVIPDITQVDSAVKYRPYIAKAVSYTATLTDRTIEVTAIGQTITLPTAVGIAGKEYVIKLTASGTATVATTSSQTIDGSTTYSLSAQYKYVKVQSNGANWLIIGNN